MTTAPAPPELRCAPAALLRGDSLIGTATPAQHFLLVEQPGPWGRIAVTESRLDPEVGRLLAERGIPLRLRVLLIRRPGRSPAPVARRWFRVDVRPGRGAVRTGTFEADAELLELGPGSGAPSAGPLFLVCAHGRHDACCAIRGRPAAAALAALAPAATWECSHVGGDRFAGNVVALPQGAFYGQVGAADVPAILAATAAGEVFLPRLRGRAALGPAVQAAEHFVRQETGELSVDGFTAAAVARHGDGWLVELDRPATADRFRVVVANRRAEERGWLTCGAVTPVRAPRWVLGELTVGPVPTGAVPVPRAVAG